MAKSACKHFWEIVSECADRCFHCGSYQSHPKGRPRSCQRGCKRRRGVSCPDAHWMAGYPHPNSKGFPVIACLEEIQAFQASAAKVWADRP